MYSNIKYVTTTSSHNFTYSPFLIILPWHSTLYNESSSDTVVKYPKTQSVTSQYHSITATPM
jgi:hypothetical protein